MGDGPSLAVLACWGIDRQRIATVETPVPGHQTLVLTLTSGEQLVLKDVTEQERRAGLPSLEQQYRLQLHLHRSGVPVAVPMPAVDGSAHAEWLGRLYVLAPFIPNDSSMTEEQRDGLYREVGAAIGRLHRALATYDGDVRSWRMDLAQRFLLEALPAVLERLGAEERDRLASRMLEVAPEMRRLLADLPEQRIHGDCHGGNMLFRQGKVVGFVDLDHLPVGPRAYDLTYNLVDAVKRNVGDAQETACWLAHLAEAVRGYGSVSELAPGEVEALLMLMLGIQLLFAEWFFAHDNPAEARVNLRALDWLYEHRGDVTLALSP